MALSLKETKKRLPAAPCGCLPVQMRVLFITGHGRTGGWLAEAFASDSASEVLLEETIGITAGLARLRDEVFDAVLISHRVNDFDAFGLLDALRTGSGQQQPIIVLGAESEQEMAALCYEAGADAYVCVNTATTRSLIWQVARAIERHRLISENRRLLQAQHHRLQLERDEADRLLAQQRALIADLESLRGKATTAEAGAASGDAASGVPSERHRPPPLPEPLVSHYRQLLKAYVIMGSGKLSEEMNSLGELLASAGVTAQQAMLLHLYVLEEMIHDLGSRSARHVMNRADILVLEVMIRLAESYRRRYREQLSGPHQLTLPGFDDPAATTFPVGADRRRVHENSRSGDKVPLT